MSRPGYRWQARIAGTVIRCGREYPAPDPADKFQLTRARQMYEQRRIGTRLELEVTLAKSAAAPAKAAEKPAKARKEKGNGRN